MVSAQTQQRGTFPLADKLGPMPARVAKFKGKPEVPRQIAPGTCATSVLPLLVQRRRELHEDNM